MHKGAIFLYCPSEKMETMTEEKQHQDLNIKDQLLITEWILRIAAIQNLMLKKGLISQEELEEALEETVNTYKKVITGTNEEN